MTAVPRLYEAMHQRIQRGLAKATPFQRKLFDLAYRARPQALRASRHAHASGERCSNRVLRPAGAATRCGKRFGGRLKAFVSGGAALNYEIGVFFLALGVPLLQGYGQTEASPVISANRPKKIKIDTVGPIFDGRRGAHRRGRRDPGPRRSGDEGLLARPRGDRSARSATAGCTPAISASSTPTAICKITDRKKDIIVLSGGDNVSPARVEGFLVLQPEIAQAMVHGDRHPHLVALIVPDADFARDWAARNGDADDDLAALADESGLSQGDRRRRSTASTPASRRSNASAASRCCRRAFTIDNAMLTPSLKIRRHKIRETWGEVIQKLYERG